MEFKDAVFLKSAVGPFVDDGLPQILFAGRSNVGKSSLLNCLTRRKLLARVSGKPGKTAQVNYFLVDGRFYLVDLPGYGYAQVSHSERERWGTMMVSFFQDVSAVALGLLVVDARHKPTSDDQHMARLYRETGLPFLVAANKCDKLKPSQVESQRAVIAERLGVEPGAIVLCSAEKGTGRDDLIERINDAILDSIGDSL